MRNEHTHIDWHTEPFPSEQPGTYLIRTAEPLTRRSRYAVASVAKISNGYLTTVGGMFAFDALHSGNRIVAWAELDESMAPREEV